MRTVNMVNRMALRLAFALFSRFFEPFENAAVRRGPAAGAEVLQSPQFFFKRFQFFDPLDDMADMLVQQGIHLAAIFCRRILEVQQRPDFAQRHVQRAAVPDERQTLDMAAVIAAVIGFGTRSLGKQSFALVVPDGFGLRESRFSQLTNFHKKLLL